LEVGRIRERIRRSGAQESLLREYRRIERNWWDTHVPNKTAATSEKERELESTFRIAPDK